MNCKNAQILISARLDGELANKERVGLDRHISSCIACSQAQEKLSGVTAAMRLWEDAEPSPWMAQRFSYAMCELEKAPQPVKPRLSRWLLGSATTGLVATALALFIMTNYPSGPSDYDLPQSSSPSVSLPSEPAQSAPMISDTDKADESAVVESAPQAVVVPHPSHKRMTHYYYAPKHRYGAGHSSTIYGGRSSRARHTQLSSRGYSIERKNEEQEQVKLLLLSKLLKTGTAHKGTATSELTGNLSNAGVAMDSALERVRGALRKAADVIEENTPSVPEKMVDMHEGKGL